MWCGHCECDCECWPLRTGLGGNARFSHTYWIVCHGVCVLSADFFVSLFALIGERRREIVFVWGMCVRCSVVQYRHQ